MKNSLILGTPFTANLPCDSSCIPIWEVVGDAFCENSVSYVIQSDGCGNSRSIEGGSACCIPAWKPRVPATGRCNNNVSEILQEDGCGSTRWVTGGANCCIPDWKVSPTIAAQCIDGVSKLTELDGCGNTRLVDGGNACVVVVPEVLEYVGVIEGTPTNDNPDATIPYTNGSVMVVASMGSRHYPIIAKMPAGTPIKLNPEWVVANKYCALDNGQFAGKTLMGLQFVFDGPAEWLTVGTVQRDTSSEARARGIEWNVVQDLSNCHAGQGKMNRLHFMETDLSRFPPAKTNTADTYYIGLQEFIVGASFNNSIASGGPATGTVEGSRRQIPVYGDFYYDAGKYVITSINSWNDSKGTIMEYSAPPYCSANTSSHEIVYACVAYS